MSSETDPIDDGVLDRLARCSTPAIADTKRESVTAVAPGIEPVHDHAAFAGTARTVVLDPAALWAPVETLDAAVAGEVIVVDADDRVEEAVWGELLSTFANDRGVAGMVTNGAIRDVAGIRDVGFPVVGRAVTPRGPSGSAEVARNVPVTVGGAAIHPGDAVVADDSGAVVVERDDVEAVASAAEAIAETEREADRLIADGTALGRAFEQAGM